MADRAWDYVIVGGGSAGSALGNRLSRRPGDARPRPRGRPARLPARRVHPHARGPDVPDRQPLLRLEVRVGARAVHERPARLPRPRQGPRRQLSINGMIFQRGNPLDYERWAADPGHGDVGLRPLPAVLQADGGLHRGRSRRPVARPRRSARPGARPGDEPAVRGLVRGRAAGRLPAHDRRQRLPPGGLRAVRPEHPARPPDQRGTGLSPPGHAAAGTSRSGRGRS